MVSVSTTPVERRLTDWEHKFRATKIWNDCVRSFRSGMPVRRHRRQLKNHEDTFTAAEAVDWLLTYLVSRQSVMLSGRRMCRENALELLRQLYQHGVFEVARPCDRKADATALRDDDTLYKFTSTPIDELARTPLALKNQRLQKSRSMNGVRGHDTSPAKAAKAAPSGATAAAACDGRPKNSRRSATPMRYRKLSSSPRTGETVAKRRLVLDAAAQSPPAIAHDAAAVASATSDKQHEQHRVPSMRTRASSANRATAAAESRCTGATAVNAECWMGAIVHRLSELLETEECETSELLSTLGVDIAQVKWNCEMAASCGIVQAVRKSDEMPRHVIRMMRYVTRWPFAAGDTGAPPYHCAYVGIERDVFANVCAHFATRAVALGGNMVDAMMRIRDRIVAIKEAKESAPSNGRSRRVRTKQADNKAAVSLSRTRSFSASAPSQRSEGSSESLEQLRCALSRLPGLLRSPSVLRRMNAYTEGKLAAKVGGNKASNDSSAALKAVLPGDDGKRRGSTDALLDTRSLYYTPPEDVNSDDCEGPWENVDTLLEAYQLLLLLVPTAERITLQYVLRFMHRAGNNRCLKLDGASSDNNRYVLLERLTGSVLHSGGGGSDGRVSAGSCVRLVAFLVDNEPAVSAPPPPALCDRAAALLDSAAVSPATPVAYCERISDTEWHKQKEAESPLLRLLDAIVDDENMDARQKRAKLKKFRSEYPAVYARRYPPSADGGAKGSKPPVPPGAMDRVKRSSVLKQIRAWKI